MIKKFSLLFVLFYCYNVFSQNKPEIFLDSVNKYLAISDTIRLSVKKIKYLNKALSFAKNVEKDSLLINIYSDLASQNISLDNKKGFKDANDSLLKIYQNKNDSTALGFYYQNKGLYFENNASIDSAYYYYNKTRVIAKSSNNKILKKIYDRLLDIYLSEKDYLGTEELAIEIINNKGLKNDYVLLSQAYVCLGKVSSKSHDFKNALKYNKKALEIIEKIKDDEVRKEQKIYNTNDFGAVYADQKNYEKALYYALKAIEIDSDLKNNNLGLYGTLIVNKGVCEIKTGRKKEAIESFNEALKIGKKLKSNFIKTVVFLKLAKLYKKENNLNKAKKYIDKALILARKINFRKLEALKLSAEIYSGEKSISFYKEYIVLQEKIEAAAQKRKNKFARVRFETQKKEEENTSLRQQGIIAEAKIKDEQNKNRIISLIAFVCLLISFFVYLFYKSRQKLFRYRANLEKAQVREQERQEIATSLHDKVVGDLRLIYERAIKSNVSNIAEPLEKVKTEIRNLSHKLGSVDFDEVSFKDQMINLVSDYYAPSFKVKLKNIDTVDWSLIAPEIKRAFYLVAREAIQNTKKHAFASEVLVDFKRKKTTLQLSIKDNGKGFDVSSQKFGLGLKNQKKRVEELNGIFSLESILKLGTTTNIEIPLIV